jgi:hypothetical protein
MKRVMRFRPQVRSLFLLLTLVYAWSLLHAQVKTVWRTASSSELEAALPVRAPVEKERIETEMRTASGIINSQGKIIAGVVLITAGYSADGKYSHFLLIQSPILIGDVTLSPGSYVLGWNRVDAGLLVHIYEAATGLERVSAVAHQMGVGARVEAFRIWPPSERSILQIGRFELAYNLRDPEIADERKGR